MLLGIGLGLRFLFVCYDPNVLLPLSKETQRKRTWMSSRVTQKPRRNIERGWGWGWGLGWGWGWGWGWGSWNRCFRTSPPSTLANVVDLNRSPYPGRRSSSTTNLPTPCTFYRILYPVVRRSFRMNATYRTECKLIDRVIDEDLFVTRRTESPHIILVQVPHPVC